MKTKLPALVCTALLGLGAILPAHADQSLAGNVTVTGGSSTGNLIVTGAIDIDGNEVTFGTQDANFGAGLFYTDNTTDTLNFFLNRAAASWLWQHTAVAAMRLDSSHKLLLYQADGTTLGATLDPVAYTLSLGTSTLYRDSNGALKTDGAFVVGGAFTAPSYTATSGTLTGGTTGLTLSAGGTDQNITFSASGTGVVVVNSPMLINDTTASVSPTTGALVVSGGVGVGGDINAGGTLTGGAAGLSLHAGGTNQNITLTPSGTGMNRLLGAGTQVAGSAAGVPPDGTAGIEMYSSTTRADIFAFHRGTGSIPLSLQASGSPVLVGTTTDSANGRLQLAAHTTSAGGIGFGSDTVLYRSDTGTLKTDGKLAVAGNARFDGAVRLAPQGDLSMGEFTSEP